MLGKINLVLGLSPILFILGNYLISQKLGKILQINKKFNLIIFVILILIQSYLAYLINLIFPSSITIYSKSTYYLFLFFGIIYLLPKFNSFKLKITLNNIIFYFVLINLFLASVIYATDADSIRYHLGQFNNLSYDKNLDLHSKISFIGDGINHIAYINNVFNLTSLLNVFVLLKCFNLISTNYSYKKRVVFFFTLFWITYLFKPINIAKTIFMDSSFYFLFFLFKF